MDIILKFDRVNNEKYNTISINIIESGIVFPEEVNKNCKILKIGETKYGYRKAVVQLINSGLRSMMELWETKINEYLKGEFIEPIKILYGNKIYPKTLLYNPTDANIIKIKSVWIYDKGKPFIQLWLE